VIVVELGPVRVIDLVQAETGVQRVVEARVVDALVATDSLISRAATVVVFAIRRANSSVWSARLSGGTPC
jgi:hypothetical protein